MKIGFLADYSPDTVQFAGESGFGCLELDCSPGSAMNANKILSGGASEILENMEQYGLDISALAWYANLLDPIPETRASNTEYFQKLIDAAASLGVQTVCTFAGRIPDKSIADNIPAFKEVWQPLARYAEDHGVRIAFENCPMTSSFPFHGINIAFKPEAWDLMFDAVPSAALGIEMDPSHLYWLHIDYIKATYQYGARIFHVHAKDTEINYGRFAEEGIYGTNWWRYRIPGWGEIRWQKFIAALLDVGYTGNLDIEHEDPVFHGDHHREGLMLGLKHLSQLVA
ncbi:MAG: sugar phosphate isomerase/epimerase [Armatimonadota bacterium]|nr:sugar phosphate isomerase/epimerase [Armatimonadota bacterium]